MADQLTEASQRLERLLIEALGTRHEAILDWAVIRFAIQDARRYRWLTKYAYIGQCFTDQVESGVILEVSGCDRRVPDEVGEFANVGASIDAAIRSESALSRNDAEKDAKDATDSGAEKP